MKKAIETYKSPEYVRIRTFIAIISHLKKAYLCVKKSI